MKTKNIDWHKYAKDTRSLKEIAEELRINERTIRRNFKKLKIKKVSTSRVGKFNRIKAERLTTHKGYVRILKAAIERRRCKV